MFDSEKLMLVASYLDRLDEKNNYKGSEVQDDLIRIANELPQKEKALASMKKLLYLYAQYTSCGTDMEVFIKEVINEIHTFMFSD